MAKEGNQLNLFEDESIEKQHPFFERKVFVSGFPAAEKRIINNLIRQKGGTVANQISKNIHYAVFGFGTPESHYKQIKKLEFNGFKIRILTTEDLERIKKGDYETYMSTSEIIKDLDLTYEYLEKYSLDLSGINPISGKEIYIGDNFKGSVDILRQMAGNLSAYGNPTMYEDTNICLLSNETTELLYKGEKDNTVKLIQDYYNSHKSPTFKLSFLTEKKFLDFIARWCNTYQDDVTYDLYVSFLNSKYL